MQAWRYIMSHAWLRVYLITCMPCQARSIQTRFFSMKTEQIKSNKFYLKLKYLYIASALVSFWIDQFWCFILNSNWSSAPKNLYFKRKTTVVMPNEFSINFKWRLIHIINKLKEKEIRVISPIFLILKKLQKK
jgi:hypothetical protein